MKRIESGRGGGEDPSIFMGRAAQEEELDVTFCAGNAQFIAYELVGNYSAIYVFSEQMAHARLHPPPRPSGPPGPPPLLAVCLSLFFFLAFRRFI